MGRAVLVLTDNAVRQQATDWIRKAPGGTRVEFKRSKRSLPQNDRFWAMLTDISMQALQHGDRRYTPDEWKDIFMHALNGELRFAPSLDGQTFVPLGYHSSDLSKDEMSDLMEMMSAWGAEHGIVFHDPSDPSPVEMESANG